MCASTLLNRYSWSSLSFLSYRIWKIKSIFDTLLLLNKTISHFAARLVVCRFFLCEDKAFSQHLLNCTVLKVLEPSRGTRRNERRIVSYKITSGLQELRKCSRLRDTGFHLRAAVNGYSKSLRQHSSGFPSEIGAPETQESLSFSSQISRNAPRDRQNTGLNNSSSPPPLFWTTIASKNAFSLFYLSFRLPFSM